VARRAGVGSRCTHWNIIEQHLFLLAGNLQRGRQTRLRGGSWNNNPTNCRAANRNNNARDNRNNNIGFRVCCIVPSTLQWPESVNGNLSSVPEESSHCSGDAGNRIPKSNQVKQPSRPCRTADLTQPAAFSILGHDNFCRLIDIKQRLKIPIHK
jgi:hypothetical protein